MIVRMARIRLAGPRAQLDSALTVLQDAGLLHIDRPHIDDLGCLDRQTARERRHIAGCLADVETALTHLGMVSELRGEAAQPADPRQARRRAHKVRRAADRLAEARTALDDERTLLLRYRAFFRAFEPLVGHELAWPDGQAFYVILRPHTPTSPADLARGLEAATGGDVEVLHRSLSSGEQAVLILASSGAAPKVTSLLASSQVEELPAPIGVGQTRLIRALPAIDAALGRLPAEMSDLEAERRRLIEANGSWLGSLRAHLHDALLRLDARSRVLAAEHLFVIEGWLPEARVPDLTARVAAAFGPEVVLTTLGREDWAAPDAPVVLSNPPMFRPFEVLTRILPLPRYGSIDPTPFVALFFPAFFGLMLGDVGYGAVLGIVALILRVRSVPGTVWRSVSAIGLACASSSIVFGLLFGELFGTLGRFVGLHPFFDREEATVSFLVLTVTIGAVHIVLGIVLAAITAWQGGHRREAVGRGVALTMLVLTALSLLAAVEVLPARLFSPFVVAVLVAFPILIALEGIVAVIELMSTVGHILSYARIMALGTASLMLAVVANELAGAMGSVAVGAVFALLFHFVNFALGLFSPTIHAMRLHYVEFFGHFFSPGGTEYRPLGRWHPST